MSDRIHIEDLTKNTTPFGLLDDGTQNRLAALKPEEREWWTSVGWSRDDSTSMVATITYRQKPKHETVVKYLSVYDWGGVGSGWNSAGDVRRHCQDALSILRIETCRETGRLISARNVEVGDE